MEAAGGFGLGPKMDVAVPLTGGCGEAAVKLNPGAEVAAPNKGLCGCDDAAGWPAEPFAPKLNRLVPGPLVADALGLVPGLGPDPALNRNGLEPATAPPAEALDALPAPKTNGVAAPAPAAGAGGPPAEKLNILPVVAPAVDPESLPAEAKGFLTPSVGPPPAENVNAGPPAAPLPNMTGPLGADGADGPLANGFAGAAFCPPPKLKVGAANPEDGPPKSFLAGEGSSCFMGLPSNPRFAEAAGVAGSAPKRGFGAAAAAAG